MNIALIGYGNMGQEIERSVADRGRHKIISISSKGRGVDKKGLKVADVAIDFTSPDIVVGNIETVLSLGIPLVVGTTGWYDDINKVEKLVKKYRGGLIYGQNFSIGANIFFNIVGYAASQIERYEGYDVFGIETHHTRKKDSPSGTAKKLAEILMNNFSQKKHLLTEKLDRKIKKDELHFVSVRGGRNFGRHEIVFDSNADEVRLMHQAWGRRGFAEGAVLAAEFIVSRKGFYSVDEMFREIAKGNQKNFKRKVVKKK